MFNITFKYNSKRKDDSESVNVLNKYKGRECLAKMLFFLQLNEMKVMGRWRTLPRKGG